MADQLLSRRAESKRTTRKVEPHIQREKGQPWYHRVLLLTVIAVGGAMVGHLGSQLTARLIAGRSTQRHPGGGEAGAASGLLSMATSVSERLLEIDQHMSTRDFGTALLLCDEALALFPGDNQLQGRRQHAEDELHNRFRYQMFQQAAARRNYAAALALFNEIPADSLYKSRATQELPSVRSHLVGEWLSTAQLAARLGQCAEARAYAAGVLALDKASASAHAVMEQCPKASAGRTE